MKVVKVCFRHPWTKKWEEVEFEVEKDCERFDMANVPIAIATCEGMGNGDWEGSLAEYTDWFSISTEMEQEFYDLQRHQRAHLKTGELYFNVELLLKEPQVSEPPKEAPPKETAEAIVPSPSKPTPPLMAEPVKMPPTKKPRAAKFVCVQQDCGTCHIRATYASRMHHVSVHM